MAWFKEICWATVESISSLIADVIFLSASVPNESAAFFKHATPLMSDLDSSVKAVENPFPMGPLTCTEKPSM